VLGRDLASAVLELPRGIGEDRPELSPPRRLNEAEMRSERIVGGEHKANLALHRGGGQCFVFCRLRSADERVRG